MTHAYHTPSAGPLFVAPHRATDPATSRNLIDREGARAVVLAVMADGRTRTDEQIVAEVERMGSRITPQRVRGARAELSHDGRLVQDGEGTTSHGGRCRAWKLSTGATV